MALQLRSIVPVAATVTLLLPLAGCSGSIHIGMDSSSSTTAAPSAGPTASRSNSSHSTSASSTQGTGTTGGSTTISQGSTGTPHVSTIPTVNPASPSMAAGVLSLGSSFTMKNGSTITVGEPEIYAPAEVSGTVTASAQGEGEPGKSQLRRVKVTFVNRSSGPVNLSSTMMHSALSEGAEINEIYSPGMAEGFPQGEVLPGHTKVFYLGYMVKPGAHFSLTISPLIGDNEGLMWDGVVE